jgi:ribosomal protein L15
LESADGSIPEVVAMLITLVSRAQEVTLLVFLPPKMTHQPANAPTSLPDQQRHSFSLHIRDKYHQLDINIILSHAFLAELKAASAVHPLHEEYSLQEDRLLLFVEVSTKLQEDENGEEKVLTGKDMVKAYRAKREGKKGVQHLFPKVGFSGKQFKARLSELRTQSGLRFSILLNSVNTEVNALRREQLQDLQPNLEEEKEEVTKQVNAKHKMIGAVLNNPAIGTRARKINVAYGGKPYHPSHAVTAESNETLVEVVLSGRNFEQTTVVTLERHLAHCSPLLKKLLETTGPQMSVTLGEPVKQIAFSEYEKKYRDHDMFECFNPINFNRFVLFVENPDLQEKYRESQEKMNNFHQKNENVRAFC